MTEQAKAPWHAGTHAWDRHDGYPRHQHSLNGALTIHPDSTRPDFGREADELDDGALRVRRVSRRLLDNITVHLANEHKVRPDKIPQEQRHWRHALAHMYGEFRPGEEHYHERPKTS